MAEPLASHDDVVAALGRDLTSEEEERYEAILAKASELFRLHSEQQLTPGASEVRLKVNGGKVYLPQRPVAAINSVTDDHGNAVPFTRFKQWLTVPRISHQFVIVDYSHGSETVPDLVRLTVAEVAKKVLSINSKATEGVVQHQETAGPFSESDTYATWAQGGQTMLAPDDQAIAESFKVFIPNVTVMQP